MEHRSWKPRPASAGAGAPQLTPGAILLWVVKGLYADSAMPRARLLQWYLELLAGVKLSPRDLRVLVDETPGLYTEPLEPAKLNFSAVLEVPPPGFKRFVSEDDPTEFLEPNCETAREVTRLLAAGGWPEVHDRSHKHYVVASYLQDVSAHLGAMSFGRVLSFVRYGSQKALLGHRGGLLVPYEHSEECERRRNACAGQPTHVASGEDYVKTWEELRCYLRALLREREDGTLEVAALKTLFRTRLRLELSETVFGYQCLSKLFADPELQDDFRVDTVPANRFLLRIKEKTRAPVCLALAIGAEPERGEEEEGEEKEEEEEEGSTES